LCSPLKGIQLQELGTILSNPYTASRVGFDEGHPGIDFAYWSRGERKSMQGHPIQSTFRGRVTSIINNRSPYGNSIIIETPLSQVPSTVQSILSRLAEIPAVIPDARLYCPGFRLPAINPPPRNSIYTLYGHLNHPSPLQVGETVECGMDIGEVGTTGFSVNHHLHLEMRAGPSGAQIESMAHYDNGASPSEMVSYCAWRASGIFISIDPILILGIAH
jgi:murein DD-endopeptidase MepM/ murein hydrolase activator NlpD